MKPVFPLLTALLLAPLVARTGQTVREGPLMENDLKRFLRPSPICRDNSGST